MRLARLARRLFEMPLILVLSLVPVCIGVMLASVSDVELNAVGSFWAVAGLLATAFYQLLVKTRQVRAALSATARTTTAKQVYVYSLSPQFQSSVGPQSMSVSRVPVGAPPRA